MDGSQKLSNQLFPIIRERIAAGKNFKRAAYTVAAWLRYLSGVTDDGQTFKVADPLAERLSAIAIKAEDDLAPYLTVSEVFPVDLKQNDLFVSEVSAALRAIYDLGARQALKNLDETVA
jgi:mannitol-1-phosphate/altronate dehydrogenase